MRDDLELKEKSEDCNDNKLLEERNKKAIEMILKSFSEMKEFFKDKNMTIEVTDKNLICIKYNHMNYEKGMQLISECRKKCYRALNIYFCYVMEGNNSESLDKSIISIKQTSGSSSYWTIAANIWNGEMQEYLQNDSNESIPQPFISSKAEDEIQMPKHHNQCIIS